MKVNFIGKKVTEPHPLIAHLIMGAHKMTEDQFKEVFGVFKIKTSFKRVNYLFKFSPYLFNKSLAKLAPKITVWDVEKKRTACIRYIIVHPDFPLPTGDNLSDDSTGSDD
jgi:hypothetical protein